MKKILLISVALFTTLSMNAQVEKLIYEMDWADVEYTEWNYFGEAPNASYYKATDEGLAINNPAINDHIWEVRVINRSSEDHGLSLEEGHDYIVRLTIKVPSDGHIFMQLGDLASSWYDGTSVTASDDWQVIDIENQCFYSDIPNGHVLLGLGEMVGTTILKKVQVYERTTQDIYRPFVEEGKVWKVGDYSGNPVQRVEYYYFDGDTIIDGKACKQMMCQRYVNPDHPYYEDFKQFPTLSYVGAYYEEDKKVYFSNETNKQFKLMYDFSINANDTLQIDLFPYVIGPRKTGGIKGFKGVYRDVWECGDEGNTYRCAPWMESVGIVYGPPTLNVFNVELGDPAWFLMSCTVGDEVIYLDDIGEDGATPDDIAGARKQRIDFTHTIKIKPKTRSKQEESDARISSSERDVARPKVKTRTRSEEEQSLYGEYNERNLDLNFDLLNDDYQVCITDESGNAVYEKAINAGSIVGLNIDISAYAEGRYTITVENSNESFTGEFNAQTTGIKEVRTKKEETRMCIYNLQGQRLNSLQKGLNIVNGQKVYVK